jgi:hypothetical protein
VHGVSTRHPGEAASIVKFFPATRVEAGFSGEGGGASFPGGADATTAAVVPAFAEAAGFAEGGGEAEVAAEATVGAGADADAAGGVAVMAMVGASLGTAIALAVGAPLVPPSVLLQPVTSASATITTACLLPMFITIFSSDPSP